MVLFKKLIVVIFCTVLFSGCNKQELSYIQYKPVYFNYTSKSEKDMFFVSDEDISAEHLDNLTVVLDYYKVPYLIKDGSVYLPLDVWEDKESIMNYTKKANNSDMVLRYKSYIEGRFER